MATAKTLRARKWKTKQRCAERCVICGCKTLLSKVYCTKHLIRARRYKRERAGYSPHRPGGRGRPPLIS